MRGHMALTLENKGRRNREKAEQGERPIAGLEEALGESFQNSC